MKLQKLTENDGSGRCSVRCRLCSAGGISASRPECPLGGDDELINLQNYYYITHTSFGQSVLDYLGDLWTQFTLQNGGSGCLLPAAGARADKLVSGGSGRLPPVHSGVDLRGHCADRMARRQASRSKKLGIACLCLLPMMFSVWQDSYGQQSVALMVRWCSTLLPALVGVGWRAALTGHRAQAVGRAGRVLRFQCCATFEIGFTYIVRFSAWRGSTPIRHARRAATEHAGYWASA